MAQIPPQAREFWELPPVCVARHDVGKLILGVSNKGYFGNSTIARYYPCIKGISHYTGNEYPKGSLVEYLHHGSIWIGGVRRGDTLVTEGFFGAFFEPTLAHDHPPLSELNPDDFPSREIEQKSNLKESEHFDKSAISHQDLVTYYTDTIVTNENIYDGHPGYRDFLDFRLHKPLYMEVTQKSFAWSYEYAEDFVIFEMSIRNMGERTISDFSLGLQLASFANFADYRQGFTDDLLGFLKSHPDKSRCGYIDTFNLVWVADNNGDPYNGGFTNEIVQDPNGDSYKSVTGVCGAFFVAVPDDPPVYFNWWTWNSDYNFGPMMKGNFRDFRTGDVGDPQGDRNKFFVMRNQEIDYDPAYTSKIDQSNHIWMYPNQEWLESHSLGGVDFRSLISFQDGFLTPGGSIPIVFAIVMGENFHTNPNNLANLPNNPDAYYANLDFSDLAKNAQWAKWIYDNPGIDTDGDGYRGEFRICVLDSVLDIDSNWIPTYAETTYYKGDGVPDWKAALPPPTPKMWVTPMFRGIHIRFNGGESENSKDIFTQMNDFEGFKVYLARDDRESSFSLIGTYDIENYDKYVWNYQKQPDPGWDLLEFPMLLRDIHCNYAFNCNDSSFDPLRFRPSQPYVHPQHPESLFYWENHNWN
ncbi:MAG TPA: hypothetical protein VHP63_01145, partial [candidate division Zixibacteria bacterium]|nr:hypothetical protein [candidate division Zixibacteria bacterium]